MEETFDFAQAVTGNDGAVVMELKTLALVKGDGEIPNSKHQIPNKHQFPMIQRKFRIWILRSIWDLDFGIWSLKGPIKARGLQIA